MVLRALRFIEREVQQVLEHDGYKVGPVGSAARAAGVDLSHFLMGNEAKHPMSVADRSCWCPVQMTARLSVTSVRGASA